MVKSCYLGGMTPNGLPGTFALEEELSVEGFLREVAVQIKVHD